MQPALGNASRLSLVSAGFRYLSEHPGHSAWLCGFSLLPSRKPLSVPFPVPAAEKDKKAGKAFKPEALASTCRGSHLQGVLHAVL